MGDELAQLAATLAGGNPRTAAPDTISVRVTRGVVQTAPGSGRITITIDGATTPIPADRLASYTPVILDNVEVLVFGARQLVLGKLG